MPLSTVLAWGAPPAATPSVDLLDVVVASREGRLGLPAALRLREPIEPLPGDGISG
ncbi:hypothetical protein [Streptomyces vinaceus]|uniref:hypothetical protein n=1 Tax=Streptomyces vinaceus TaxID=1960 RepID=UPI003813B0C7